MIESLGFSLYTFLIKPKLDFFQFSEVKLTQTFIPFTLSHPIHTCAKSGLSNFWCHLIVKQISNSIHNCKENPTISLCQ